jgi:hypothetical protein
VGVKEIERLIKKFELDNEILAETSEIESEEVSPMTGWKRSLVFGSQRDNEEAASVGGLI